MVNKIYCIYGKLNISDFFYRIFIVLIEQYLYYNVGNYGSFLKN